MKKDYNLVFEEYITKINKSLFKFTKEKNFLQKSVIEAAEYSLSAGGKRIRPMLMLEFYKMCGGKKDVQNIAAAIEMTHTFSLIHDDLPCMDNDDFRRGKPSCHKAFDEPIALLAGDALAVLPYEVIAKSALDGKISSDCAIKLIHELAVSVGSFGMIGGQIIDIESESKGVTEETLVLRDRLKTGALIECCCVMGCILADANAQKITLARKYAEKIGLAFQIIDDILDVTSSFEQLGKSINSDSKQKKTTYVTLYGLEKSKQIAAKLTAEATKILDEFNENEFLKWLTNMLFERNK